MSNNQKKTSLVVTAAACAALATTWLVTGGESESASAQQSNFMGGSPAVESAEEVSTLRILFPAGVRSNWHSHTWGQLLMIEEGTGLTQERGGSIREVGPGEPWWTPADVEHWHGAHPEEDALQMTIYEGDVEWMEPVSDEEYHAHDH